MRWMRCARRSSASSAIQKFGVQMGTAVDEFRQVVASDMSKRSVLITYLGGQFGDEGADACCGGGDARVGSLRAGDGGPCGGHPVGALAAAGATGLERHQGHIACFASQPHEGGQAGDAARGEEDGCNCLEGVRRLVGERSQTLMSIDRSIKIEIEWLSSLAPRLWRSSWIV